MSVHSGGFVASYAAIRKALARLQSVWKVGNGDPVMTYHIDHVEAGFGAIAHSCIVPDVGTQIRGPRVPGRGSKDGLLYPVNSRLPHPHSDVYWQPSDNQ